MSVTEDPGFGELRAGNLGVRLARNIGMSAVHALGPLKREFMRRAMGID